MDLKDLGFTQAELQERVVDRLCEELLDQKAFDEDGREVYRTSRYKAEVEKRVVKAIDAAVTKVCDGLIAPRIEDLVNSVTLQKTNEYGEKKGEPVTFIEYLVKRAETYMTEQVDYNGNDKATSRDYNWTGRTTRVAHMVNSHLQFHIETAMKKALADANSAIAKGLEDAVKIKIAEIQAGLKVAVTTK